MIVFGKVLFLFFSPKVPTDVKKEKPTSTFDKSADNHKGQSTRSKNRKRRVFFLLLENNFFQVGFMTLLS